MAYHARMRASEMAYRQLRDDIIQWRLEPGAPMGEIEMAARVGVSRTPVRDALSRLIAEGLVTTDNGRTARVAAVSLDGIRELFELREALETQAARLAARRRDTAVFLTLKRDFTLKHRELMDRGLAGAGLEGGADRGNPYALSDRLDDAIDEAIGNLYLRNALRDLRGHLARVRRHAHADPDRLRQATTEHLVVVDAILERDETLAAQATAVHLHNSLNSILANIPSLSP